MTKVKSKGGILLPLLLALFMLAAFVPLISVAAYADAESGTSLAMDKTEYDYANWGTPSFKVTATTPYTEGAWVGIYEGTRTKGFDFNSSTGGLSACVWSSLDENNIGEEFDIIGDYDGSAYHDSSYWYFPAGSYTTALFHTEGDDSYVCDEVFHFTIKDGSDYSIDIVPDEDYGDTPRIGWGTQFPGACNDKHLVMKVSVPSSKEGEAWIGISQFNEGNWADYAGGFTYVNSEMNGQEYNYSDVFSDLGTGYYRVTVYSGGSYPEAFKYVYYREDKTGSPVNLSDTEFTYNGSVQKPTVTSVSGVNAAYYTATIPESKDAGDYTVEVQFHNAYFGSSSATYKINPKSIDDETITVEDIPDQVYAGTDLTPEVVVKDGETELVKDTDYEVSYSNNDKAGDATVTISGKGNYTGSTNKEFHIHGLTKTAASEPTCTGEGNSDYWTCSECGKYFSDAEGTTGIEKDSWVIAALGHDLEKTEAVAAACETAGNSEYYTCKREGCGKFFSDANGQNEIEEDSWVIAATDHDYSGDWEKNDADTHKKVCANNSEHFITENHTWNEGDKTTAPTLDAEGEMTFTCTKCQETRTEPIPMLTADQYIDEMIKDIWDKATLEDKDAVEAAAAAFDGLSDEQKADVSEVTKAKLDVAQERIAAAETQAAADAAAAQAAADQQDANLAAEKAAKAQEDANLAAEKAAKAQEDANLAAEKAKRDQDAADDAAAKAAKAQEDANTAAAKAVEAQATADEAAAKAAEAQQAADDAVAKAEAAQKAADEATAKAAEDQKAAEEKVAAAEKAVADAQAAQKAAEDRAAAAEAAAESKEELEALRIENAQLKVEKQKVTGLKVKAQKKGKAVVSFKSLGEGYTYVISKSTKKNKGFKKAATTDTTKVTVKKGLKKGKAYYFKVRAYKNIGGKDIYTGYSKVVKIKAK